MELRVVGAESSCPAGRALFWIDFILGTSNIEEMFYMYQTEENQDRRMGERSGRKMLT